MTHALKTIQPFYSDVASGKKTFEVRKNDRPFKEGDTVILQEYNSDHYIGSEVKREITYILPGGKFGVEKDFCVLGLKEITDY